MTHMKEKYINFFTDYGFKRLFGSEPTKDCLIDFLNGLLEDREKPIVELEYRNTEHLGALELDRKAIFDLYCTTSDGSHIIVELQKAKQQFFKDRALFYSTFPIQEQAQKGEWNFKLSNIYTIAILDFIFDDDSETPDKYLYDVKLTEQETHQVFYDKLSFIYLEMPRFKKTSTELKTQQDKWLYAIKHLNALNTIPDELKQDIFENFFKAAEVAKLTPKEKENYEKSLKYYRDLNNVIDTAFDEGKEEGRKEEEEKRKDAEAKRKDAEGKLQQALKNIIEKGIPEEEARKLLGLD
ncbi:MAG: PD-(D/E)XK nuclease family transposase [Planctomycetes bacterium]|nr:PD-(D/E)XK nuclease family transposase [Planctomycetota bacterium]